MYMVQRTHCSSHQQPAVGVLFIEGFEGSVLGYLIGLNPMKSTTFVPTPNHSGCLESFCSNLCKCSTSEFGIFIA